MMLFTKYVACIYEGMDILKPETIIDRRGGFRPLFLPDGRKLNE